MWKVLSSLLLFSLALGPTVWAQDDITGGVTGGITERPLAEFGPEKGVFDSPLNVAARIGNFNFQDRNANHTNRILEGFTFNWNASQLTSNIANSIFGLESGILFSHNGATGSNFWGTNSGSMAGDIGSNVFLIPMHIVAGYKFTDRFSLAALGGANLLYRSVSSSMLLGRGSDSNGLSSSTEFFPSLGLNAGYELSKSFGLALRGDAIFAPSSPLYTATLGATFPLA